MAALRSVHGRSAAGSPAHQLVELLIQQSEEFAALWERHEVAGGVLTVKRLLQPILGLLTLDCQVLTAESLTERLVVLTALTPADARKVDLLREIS